MHILLKKIRQTGSIVIRQISGMDRSASQSRRHAKYGCKAPEKRRQRTGSIFTNDVSESIYYVYASDNFKCDPTKKISYQCLELIIIDAEENSDQDDQDVRMVLYDLDDQLNYLLIVTDRPERYESFMDEMYEENGLIVQQIQKTSCRQVRGNVVLDFERSSSFFKQNAVHADAVYLPVYKRPWEIGENLDILVPVGYNTLIVEGILPADWQECRCMNERDRLDWEFRKG
ncbi:hypothetical protein C823_005722 [Eubacterium plexicaudatum ASF492]|nr:hypothetical protein C823_005722 [Eubacterium plexicaudatum ASF492]